MADYTEQLNQARTQEKKDEKEDNLAGQIGTINQITNVEFILILLLAIAKDVLDWILLFALGLGLFISRITNLFVTAILWIWCFSRLHKFPTKRFIGSFSIEMLPVIGDLSPTWTIFIVTIWIEQRIYLPKLLKRASKSTK